MITLVKINIGYGQFMDCWWKMEQGIFHELIRLKYVGPYGRKRDVYKARKRLGINKEDVIGMERDEFLKLLDEKLEEYSERYKEA